jgi:hypothetical protein
MKSRFINNFLSPSTIILITPSRKFTYNCSISQIHYNPEIYIIITKNQEK